MYSDLKIREFQLKNLKLQRKADQKLNLLEWVYLLLEGRYLFILHLIIQIFYLKEINFIFRKFLNKFLNSEKSRDSGVDVNMKVIMSKVYASQRAEAANKILLSHLSNYKKIKEIDGAHKIKEAASWVKKLYINLTGKGKSEVSSDSHNTKFIIDF